MCAFNSGFLSLPQVLGPNSHVEVITRSRGKQEEIPTHDISPRITALDVDFVLQSGNSIGEITEPVLMSILSKSDTSVRVSWDPNTISHGAYSWLLFKWDPEYYDSELHMYQHVPCATGLCPDTFVESWPISQSVLNQGHIYISFNQISDWPISASSGDLSSGPYYFYFKVQCGLTCLQKEKGNMFLVDPPSYLYPIGPVTKAAFSYDCNACPAESDIVGWFLLNGWELGFCTLCLQGYTALSVEFSCENCSGQLEYSFTRFYFSDFVPPYYDFLVEGSASAMLNTHFSMQFELHENGEKSLVSTYIVANTDNM